MTNAACKQPVASTIDSMTDYPASTATDAPRRLVRLLTLICLGLAIASTLGIIVRASFPLEASPAYWLGILPLTLLNVSPYVALAAVAVWIPKSLLQGIVVLAGSVLLALFGLAILVDGILLHPKLVNMFLFLATPSALWMGVLVLVPLVVVMRLIQRGNSPPRREPEA